MNRIPKRVLCISLCPNVPFNQSSLQQVQNKLTFPEAPKVSQPCCSLIKKILMPQWSRLNITQIRNDPWILAPQALVQTSAESLVSVSCYIICIFFILNDKIMFEISYRISQKKSRLNRQINSRSNKIARRRTRNLWRFSSTLIKLVLLLVATQSRRKQ